MIVDGRGALELLAEAGSAAVAERPVSATEIDGVWHAASCTAAGGGVRLRLGDVAAHLHRPCVLEALDPSTAMILDTALEVTQVLDGVARGATRGWVVGAAALTGGLELLADLAEVPGDKWPAQAVAERRLEAARDGLRQALGPDAARAVSLAVRAEALCGSGAPRALSGLRAPVRPGEDTLAGWARRHVGALVDEAWRVHLDLRRVGADDRYAAAIFGAVESAYRRRCEARRSTRDPATGRRVQPVWWDDVRLPELGPLTEAFDAAVLDGGPFEAVPLGTPGKAVVVLEAGRVARARLSPILRALPALLPSTLREGRYWVVSGVPADALVVPGSLGAERSLLDGAWRGDTAEILAFAGELVDGESLSWPEALASARRLLDGDPGDPAASVRARTRPTLSSP